MTRKEWFVNRDRNSRFFNQIMKSRKTRSKIVKLKGSSGVWVEELAQIEQILINDFSARFKSTQVNSTNIDTEMLNLVSAEDNDTPLQSIQDPELKDAIFQMDKFKAPGPDGFKAALISFKIIGILLKKMCTLR